MMRFTALLMSLPLLLVACKGQTGPDSNTDVFVPVDQAVKGRKLQLMYDWQDLAARIANGQRPDVRTSRHPSQPFALLMSADGLSHAADLFPIHDKLMASQGKELEPLREFLDQEFPKFDRQRLKAMGFEQAKFLLYPILANSRQTADMISGNLTSPLVNRVVIDLNWLPVARWPGSEAKTLLNDDVIKKWNVSSALVNDAALGNLKRDFISQVQPFETTDLPGMGRYGSLRTDTNAAYVLLPEFLTGVRRQWNSSDDLVLFMPSRTTVNFVERKNEKLLESLYPEWNKLFMRLPEPLTGTLILSTDKGLRLCDFKPATQPTTKPKTRPATKRAYIVD